MKFICKDRLSIAYNDRELLDGIKLWVRGQGGEKQYLDLCNLSDNSADFSNDRGDILATVSIKSGNGAFALHFDASYFPKAANIKGQNHLDGEAAMGMDVSSVYGAENFTANYMRCEFWCATRFCAKLSDLPERTQALLTKTGGNFVYMLTTCDKEFKTNIKPCEDGGFTLFAYSHYPKNRCDTEALIIAFGNDLYQLPDIATEYGLRLMGKSGKLRENRRFPEIFEYLGWCSWDAFHMDVSHDGLVEKATEFKNKDIPVRWILFDDMWADVKNNSLGTMKTRELYDIEADPMRFENGLKASIEELKKDFGMKIGIWYPTTGYWNGIDPEGIIAKEHRELLEMSSNGKLIPSADFTKLFNYFYMFNAFFRFCGADFVKVDYQSYIFDHYNFVRPIGEVAKNIHEAIEAAAGVCFDGNLINCMGMSNENFWNRPQSILNRISGDFRPEDRKWFIQHLIQCSFNSYVQGSIYAGDWDMWWSDDEQAKKNAVLRAMSGGPVYISDKLDRSIKDIIMPIVYSDGRIIRLQNSARPTADCFFTNPETNGKIFKIFNTAENAGIVAAFNLDQNENEVIGEIKAADVYGFRDGKYVLFDYFSRSVEDLDFAKGRKVTLKSYDDFKLFYIIPCNNDIVPVGIIDKYMAPATFKCILPNKCIAHSEGEFCFISDFEPTVYVDGCKAEVFKISNRLFSVKLEGNDEFVLEW